MTTWCAFVSSWASGAFAGKLVVLELLCLPRHPVLVVFGFSPHPTRSPAIPTPIPVHNPRCILARVITSARVVRRNRDTCHMLPNLISSHHDICVNTLGPAGTTGTSSAADTTAVFAAALRNWLVSGASRRVNQPKISTCMWCWVTVFKGSPRF